MTGVGLVSGVVRIRDLGVREEWKVDAACRDMDTAVFFPTRGEDVRAAQAVCDGCPVRAECLEYALTTADQFGIWGGESERSRRRLRSARARRRSQ